MATGLLEKYRWNKGYDEAAFVAGAGALIKSSADGISPEAGLEAMNLLRKMTVDARITDIRTIAYILATACKEGRLLRQYDLPKLKKDGSPQLDKAGNPVMRHPKLWSVMQPIEEGGRGADRDYFLPVKLAKTVTGALVTEQDGEQFSVTDTGKVKIASGTAVGSPASGKVTATYTNAAGAEHAYFGRGLVQLTWWNSYATAGVELGIGLELLFNPDRLLEFDLSYDVMTIGMLYGKTFANGKRCSDYFTDEKTDYVNARNMVNSKDKIQVIVDLALGFEALLLASKKKP
jgi:hypothetical protein